MNVCTIAVLGIVRHVVGRCERLVDGVALAMNIKPKLKDEQKPDLKEWNEERMDIIGQNGNSGEHYDYLVEDAHLWDNRELGADEEFVGTVEDYEEYTKQNYNGDVND